MKLIIQNNRVAGTATDDYAGLDEAIPAPTDFDISRMGEYVVVGGIAEIPQPSPKAVEAARVAALWQAADTYEKAQISGSATALLVVGVIQGLPVSLAIKGWIKTIWTEYYTRKATGSTDTDFSFAGPMPHTVPDLMAELGE